MSHEKVDHSSKQARRVTKRLIEHHKKHADPRPSQEHLSQRPFMNLSPRQVESVEIIRTHPFYRKHASRFNKTRSQSSMNFKKENVELIPNVPPLPQHTSKKQSPNLNELFNLTEYQLQRATSIKFNDHQLQRASTSTSTNFNKHRHQQKNTNQHKHQLQQSNTFNRHQLQQASTSTSTDIQQQKTQINKHQLQ